MPAHLYLLSALGGVLAGPLIALSSLPPKSGEPLLVVSLNDQFRSRAIVEAGGRQIGPVDAVLSSFAVSDDPEFVPKLRSSGLWFVFDGRPIAGLCGVKL